MSTHPSQPCGPAIEPLHRRSSSLYGLLALCIVLASSALASAQETAGDTTAQSSTADAARGHFQKGVDYYTEGDLTAALVELQRAYALQPAYRLLYNLGQVTYEQRDYVSAERYFRDYLDQGKDEIEPTRRQEVEHELERLRGRVADVRVRSNREHAKLFVDDRMVGETPLSAPLRLSAGRRNIRAEAPGYEPVTATVDVVGGEARAVSLDFGPSLTGDGNNDASGQAASSSNAALWMGVTTAALALGAGGMAYSTSRDDAAYSKALQARTTRSDLDAITDRTERKALITDLLLGATVVSGAITLVLLLTDKDRQEQAPAHEARLSVGPGSLRASF